MHISYKPLWHTLVERNMRKEDLRIAAGTEQQCVRLPYNKDQMGEAIGRDALAMAAITDVSLALALVKALPEPEKYKEALEILSQKSQKAKKRQAEAKAHARNVRTGKKKHHEGK